MSVLEKVLSLAAAGTMLVSGAINKGAPQNDADGNLFLEPAVDGVGDL